MNSPAAEQRNANWNLLLLAAWFGLTVGLVEGAGLFVFQQMGWLKGHMEKLGVWVDIFWIAPVFDLLLFGVVGVAVMVAGRMFSRLPVLRLGVFLFAFLAFFDWLALVGRIRHRGMLVLALGLAVVFTRWFSRNQAQVLRFLHRSLPWLAAATVLMGVSIPGGLWLKERRAIASLPASAPGSPNILVVLVDTLRADHLSVYGYDRRTSPNLDRLAREGVLFENAFATSSWSLPSHASLLTGRYPYEQGADGMMLNDRYLTLGEALHARGYRTAAFSANHYQFTRRQGFGRGFIHFEDFFHSFGDMATRTVYGRKVEEFVLRRLSSEEIPARKRAADVNRSLLRWIERDPHKPFFAFLNYFDVHGPFVAPEPFRSKFSRQGNKSGEKIAFMSSRKAPTPKQLEAQVSGYDGSIAYVDYHFGLLIAELQRRGLAHSTLVVVTSDHGESFGEHGLYGHSIALYRELIRVPLLFWMPGTIPAGVRLAQPVSQASLPATLVDLIGERGQALFPGPSLALLWQAPEAHPNWPYPLAELSHRPYVHKRNPAYHGASKSLVTPQWHYIAHEKFGVELYDWVKDPGELNNLADTPEGQRIASDFATYLESLLGQAHEQGRLDLLLEEQTR